MARFSSPQHALAQRQLVFLPKALERTVIFRPHQRGNHVRTGRFRLAAGAQRLAPPGEGHRLHVRSAHLIAKTVFHLHGLGNQSAPVKLFPLLKGCRIHPDGFQSNHPHPPK